MAVIMIIVVVGLYNSYSKKPIFIEGGKVL